MFKRTIGELEVKKVIDRFEEQQEKIPPIQENEQQIQEHEEQQEEGILQEPLEEIQPDNAPPQLVHRSSRPHKPSQRYPPSNYILFTDEGEPNFFQEACKVDHSKEWKKK